jgi:hypothetical protein
MRHARLFAFSSSITFTKTPATIFATTASTTSERDSNGGIVRFIRFDGHQRFLRKSIFSSIDDDIYGTKVTPTDVVREKRPVIAGSWIYVRTSVLRGGHLGRALDGFVPHVSNLNRDVNAASVTSLQV